MRNISFSLTTEQIRNRTKTVTRRLGWKNLKPGDLLQGCVKCMGLKPGEKIQKLGVIRVVSVRREPLRRMDVEPFYGMDEARKEGFIHNNSRAGWFFVRMFCKHMKCTPETEVTRIEFEYT